MKKTPAFHTNAGQIVIRSFRHGFVDTGGSFTTVVHGAGGSPDRQFVTEDFLEGLRHYQG
jgi:hypothetical protein